MENNRFAIKLRLARAFLHDAAQKLLSFVGRAPGPPDGRMSERERERYVARSSENLERTTSEEQQSNRARGHNDHV